MISLFSKLTKSKKQQRVQMENYCLFTNTLLDETTKEEHTMLRSIGGRIKSQQVCSSDFNELCGQTIDQHFNSRYREICRALSPLMASEHKQGMRDVIIDGETKKVRLDSKNQLSLKKKYEVLEHHENGKPKIAHCKTIEEAFEFGEKIGLTKEQILTSWVPLTQGKIYNFEDIGVSTDLELSLLKCSLLSFEHFLNNDSKLIRFTRDPALLEVKEIITDALDHIQPTKGTDLFKHVNVKLKEWNSISLGLQFEKIENIKEIRSKIYVDVSPFEHFLIATGNSATKTIDILFYAFSHEPWGFRVATDWEGVDFQYCIINPIMKETCATGIHEVNFPVLSCSHTQYRSVPGPKLENEPKEAWMSRHEPFIQKIGEIRNELHMAAIAHVEIHAPDYVWGQINQTANWKKISISQQAKERIFHYYISIADDEKNEIDEIIIQANLKDYENDKKSFMKIYSETFSKIITLYPDSGSVFTKELNLEARIQE